MEQALNTIPCRLDPYKLCIIMLKIGTNKTPKKETLADHWRGAFSANEGNAEQHWNDFRASYRVLHRAWAEKPRNERPILTPIIDTNTESLPVHMDAVLGRTLLKDSIEHFLLISGLEIVTASDLEHLLRTWGHKEETIPSL